MSISILPVKDSDIPKILDIQIEVNLSKWTAEDYLKEVTRQKSILLAAKTDYETVGFLAARFDVVNEFTVEPVKYAELDILNFGVFKRYQKKGVGSLLFENLFDRFTVTRLKTIWLEVRESNLDSIRFYKKRGFTAIQTRKNFYRQPVENAVVMKLECSTTTDDRNIFCKT